YSAADFENATSTIVIGEAATRAVAPQLATLALDQQAWTEHMAARKGRHLAAGTIHAVRIDPYSLRHVSVAAVQAKVTIKPGATFNMDELQANLNSLYASGDFQNVNHRFEQDTGGRTLVIEPVEKEWGPNYIRGGFRLSTDLAGESDFSVLLNHRSKWLNAAGLEWRNDVSLGQVMSINSQLYQPFDAAGDWFAAPVFRLSQTRDNLIVNERPVATYTIRQHTFGFDLGRHIDNATTLRFGLERGSSRADPSVAVPDFATQSDRIAVVKLEYLQDRLDDWVFPTTGTFSFANLRVSAPGMGADASYRRLEGGLEGVWGVRQHRISLAARGGKIWGADAPLLELFSLGGVLNMSGYPNRQFIGQGYGYGRAMYSRQTEFFGLKNIYLGGTLEAGHISRRFNGAETGTKFSAGVFGALNTGLGPFTMGVGVGENGNRTFYLFFGKP
ncbi:MAG TPA: BamA/TamA family outer membrane protein, partial [Telluria sp.]